ncbi:MAG TPA: DUF1015 family protein [Bacteroidales bacterium]|jgi:uncharacterized protein (DUF1015 family)|nr:DUF1015 domain-containing protein [Bacteroidales bacterium]MCZ2282320.1 DUF1015 family protein [Bacteroidales bacterium]NLH32638.1 DUF1015 domain-containing protein [Lentimicrobium sp.]HPX34111.1 DUF1015 family protein [Bacteroidales bacterium]HQB47336.1 DUF1015 family protein [Bacteroidales bacterium]
MAILKAFKGLRPPKEIARDLASRPYDVLNSEEARKEAYGNKYSLLHIIKPEIDLPEDIDLYAPEVYKKAKENFELFQKNGWLVPDDDEYLYIYAQTMNNKTQYGLVGCAAVEDYMNNRIKKHELTRKAKEEDRMKHVRITNANMEPVFFTYPAIPKIDSIVADWVKNHEPIYDFIAVDGFGHHFWVVDDKKTIELLINLFADLPVTYVADGHHRTAAAALVGNEKRMNNPNHKGDEEYNYFLAVHFPDNQLTIIDYNRVVTDLNGMTKQEFINNLKVHFDIVEKGENIYKPDRLHTFGMYIDKKWYSLTAKPGTYNDSDPIGVLDVTILSNLVFDQMLNIKDLRTSERIDFVGGIRGLEELERRVDSGEMAAAFALYPVSMQQLINIADTNNIMPPKTTWFEPKLRSGLVVHLLDKI